ncbi:MAG: thiamine pyrophosphate-dependent dehydrogenase E1 component subunit alpha [Rhizobiaceae bacterium]|nr:thiamine pyrophosphate-dependent dehydrogenase E1 component subunit alpha [Rhizobiaceae bacterium]
MRNTVPRRLELFRTMWRIRAFEEEALDAHRAQEIAGPLHVSIGQEAVSAGLCINLETADRLTSNHRGHGHVLAKGADPKRMLAELYGRADGYCGGKGGSMHIADFSVGMLGANGVVAGGIPIAVGAAQGLKLLGEKALVVCIFGDGAVNRGPFLEGFNWAALFRLPVLFVCEDNGVAAFTQTATMTAGPGIVARAQSMGVEGRSVDGNDVVAVDEAVAELVEAIRATGEPRFLHAQTYRLMGHTSTDAAAWRSQEEVQSARQSEPIGRLRALLLEEGCSERDLDGIERAARQEMQEARRFAQAAPWPLPEDAFSDVQDIGAEAWRR